ncbi:MAG: hypothetical protein RQ866_01525 [Bacteroidales bacterium]|nr:hypothetical protein [Bacteroidales bacterium]
MVKLLQTFIIVVVIQLNGVIAQTPSHYKLQTTDTVIEIPYYLIHDTIQPSVFTNYELPLYIFNETTFQTTMDLLSSYAFSEQLFTSFALLNQLKDSLDLQQDTVLYKLLQAQNERVKMYKDRYEDVYNKNKKLTDNLERCIQLNEKKIQSTRGRNLVWGAIGGFALGVITGIILL